MLRYFDAHCDTIYRCELTGDDSALDFGADTAFQRAYFDACHEMRQNGGHVDLLRGCALGQYAQFFALFADPAEVKGGDMWAMCQRLHSRFEREMAANEDIVAHCRTGAEVDAAVAQGKCAALLSVEGADLLNCDVHNIPTAARWGVRLCNPVWNHANVLSGTNVEDTSRGLSAAGKDFVHALNEHGIYTDVSHISDAGFWDVIRTSRMPVVASHSNSRSLCPHPRNLTDDMFKAVRDSGGVVGINLYLHFVGGDTMYDLVAHFDRFLAMNGGKTVCLGGDLDGCEQLAGGLQGIQDIPKLYEALRRRGYGEELLQDVFWNNLHRLI